MDPSTMSTVLTSRHRRSARFAIQRVQRRRGAATVELAVLLPVILIVVLGSIESASMIFLRQALVQASYEAAKVAAKTGDNAQARSFALAVTKGRQIKGVTIQFEPGNIRSAARGTLIRVTVSAPGDNNSVLPFGLFRGRKIHAQATMARE
jgi:Flp pilus assembly protein TadG